MSEYKPIIYCAEETDSFRRDIKANIMAFHNEKPNLLLDYPVVYIHAWKTANDLYDVYIGESNDIVDRTKTHWKDHADSNKWQSKMHDSTIYVIGHKLFNKSLTLDIENKLIQYISSMGGFSIHQVHNGRGNPQNQYYTHDELTPIFEDIWNSLRDKDKRLFFPRNEVENFALFKASPMHTLTYSQMNIQQQIVNRVKKAINEEKYGQLIFIQGEAGTGKTVLTSHAFYDLFNMKFRSGKKVHACLMVNHDEQLSVYNAMAQTLNFKDENDEYVVYKPTSFINKTFNYEIDVSFVDEAHLLLTQGKQSYRGKNQLEDIIKKSRVTVVMFDENQILTAQQYWEAQVLEGFKSLAIKQGNFLELTDQMRMNAGPQTIKWIDSFTKDRRIESIPYDEKYEIKVFDSPESLQEAIKNKSLRQESKLSRLIATYDWDYSSLHAPTTGKYWSVEIGNWSLPWNRELLKDMSPQEIKNIKTKAWHEQEQTINEVGSTFTIQGFDLVYAGVILGPSITYRNGRIVIDPSKSKNDRATQKRTLSNNSKQSFGEILIQHEMRVLMTRGVKGLYIYACDEELRDALKNSVPFTYKKPEMQPLMAAEKKVIYKA